MKAYEQAPDEELDYETVIVGSDTVTDAVASISPDGPTLGPVGTTDTAARVRVGGVELGVNYILTMHIELASGQHIDNSCKILGKVR